jgi:soluble lytic murein transglycosylase
MAAARFESDRGRPDLAIGWLLVSQPQLGTVALAEAPREVARSYLPLRWQAELAAAAAEAGLPPWLVAGLARQESLFNPIARSPRGAVGLLQLLPSTARLHAAGLGLGRRPDLTDPATNLRLGARELARLLGRFGALEPALVAYNAGETRARRWWARWPERELFTEQVPIPESYNYVRRVSFLAEAYRLVYADVWRSVQ